MDPVSIFFGLLGYAAAATATHAGETDEERDRRHADEAYQRQLDAEHDRRRDEERQERERERDRESQRQAQYMIGTP